MVWFLDFDVEDDKGFSSTMRVPVTAGTVPAAYITYANAVAAAIFGGALISLGGVPRVNLVMADIATPIAASANSEIRNKWQASMQVGGVPVSRFSIPARSPALSFIVPGSKVGANLSDPAFSDALVALLGAGTVHMVEPDEGTNIAAWGPVIATTRSRKTPRYGGSR